MSIAPRSTKKLEQSRFFLRRIREETRKTIGKEQFAIEALLSACLGAAKSAFYRLEKEIGKTTFKPRQAQWRKSLSRDDREFFNRMLKLRDEDVHVTDPQTSVKQRWLPAHMVPNVEVSAPPGVVVPNPAPGGYPPFAVGWVGVADTTLEGQEIADICERFINLVAGLISACKSV